MGPINLAQIDIRVADAAPAVGGGEAGAPWAAQGTSVAARGLQSTALFCSAGPAIYLNAGENRLGTRATVPSRGRGRADDGGRA